MPLERGVFAGDYRFVRVVLRNIAQRMGESPQPERVKLHGILRENLRVFFQARD